MTKLNIHADIDYIDGHLRYGHYELEVEKSVWDKLSDDEKREYIEDVGELEVDDFEINDIGDITEIQVTEIE